MKITIYSLDNYVQKEISYKELLNKVRMPGHPREYLVHKLTFTTYYIEIRHCDTHIDIENIDEREVKEITDILDAYLYSNIKEEIEEIDLDKENNKEEDYD